MDNTKNRAINLHDTLFQALENLSNDELLENPELLERELRRTKGICEVSDNIMKLAELQLNAAKLVDGNEIQKTDVPRLLC